MRLDFKRIMSSVLAFVMLFSSLVMVNVVSVSAASTDDFEFTADDFFTTGTPNNNTQTLSPSAAVTAVFGVLGSTDYYAEAGARASKNGGGYTNNTDKPSLTNELRWNGSRSLSFTPAKNGKLYLYVYTSNNSMDFVVNNTVNGDITRTATPKNTVNKLEYDVHANQNVTIKFTTNAVVLCIKYSSVSDTYSWKLDDSQLSPSFQGKVSIDEEVTGATNTLKYSDNDYIVDPNFVHLSEKTPQDNNGKDIVKKVGTAFTVTPTDDIFIKTKAFNKEDIHFANAANKVLRLDCQIHKDTVHSIKLDADGYVAGIVVAGPDGKAQEQLGLPVYLPYDTYNIQMSGGKATLNGGGTSITIGEETSKIEGSFEATQLKKVTDATIDEGEIDITKGLIMSDSTDITYIYDGEYIADGYIQVVGREGLSGDVMMVRDEEMSGDHSSNVVALELSHETEADGGLKFTIDENVTKNLGVEVTCTSSTDKELPSLIGIKDESSTPKTLEVSERIEPEIVPSGRATLKYDKLEKGKSYTIFNAGTSPDAYDNLRIYTIKFVEAKENTEGYVAMDSYNLNSNTLADAVTRQSSNNYAGTYENMVFKQIRSLGTSDITLRSNGSIEFKVAQPCKLKVTFGNNSKNLKLDGGKYASEILDASKSPVEVTLEADTTYTISGAESGNNSLISNLTFTADAPATKYPVTLKGTNNTAEDVTVKIMKESAEVGSFTATKSTTFSHEIAGGLEAGEYTLSATGYKFEPSTFTVAEGGNTGTDSIVISESQTVEFPIKIDGAESEVKITVDGRELTFDSDNSYTQNISKEVGANITIAMNSNVANKITGWGENFDPNAYASNKFTETVDRTGFTFTYNKNALTTVDSSKEYPTSASPLDYGNYGYGKKKSTQAGAKIAEDTAELNNVSGVVTLEDYMSGYSDTDQRLIINENAETGVKFKAEGDGTVVIDYSAASNNNIKVTVNSAEQSLSTVPNSTKHKFDVKANDNVEIRSKGTLSRSVQIKSIRYQTDGNVLRLNDNAVSSVDINSLSVATQSALSGYTDTSSTVFARIIGTFNSNDIEPSTVDGVGIMVVPEADITAKLSAGTTLSAYYDGLSSGNEGIDLYENEALYDGVYDGVNDDQQISGSALNDNIYYMLRHINIEPGNYYLFPYTKVNGIAEFDIAEPITSADTIQSYLKTFAK